MTTPALDSNNVRVGVTGMVYVGTTAATAPTGTAGALTGFAPLGYVSEEGVTEAPSRSVENLKAWQNGDVVRTAVTEASLAFNFTLIETNAATLELFYGVTATTGSTDGSIDIIPAKTGGRRSFVIDVVDGAELIRIYVPAGEVTETGEVVYRNGEPIGYPITITAYPVDGKSATKFTTALKSA